MAEQLLEPLLGASVLDGAIDGPHASLRKTGSEQFTQDACSYVLLATLNAAVHDDAIDGTVYYQAVTDGGVSREHLDVCISEQRFMGTRTE